jgi:ribosomal protein L15
LNLGAKVRGEGEKGGRGKRGKGEREKGEREKEERVGLLLSLFRAQPQVQ